MEVCKSLKILAEEFKKQNTRLYIVGGFVRDTILNKSGKDIDIASTLGEQDVSNICTKLKFKCKSISATLGTLEISTPDGKMEYTRFRKENYKNEHTPSDVQFVDDIMTDCLRRDFTINSIYYDIAGDEIIDLVGGVDDLNHRLLKTTNKPSITLGSDGLRILRAVRLCSLLNLNIEKETHRALIENIAKLNFISKERVLDEIKKTFGNADYDEVANKKFFNLINQLNLLEYIFNTSLLRIKKFKKSEVRNFYKLSLDSRLIGFYILILSKYLRHHASDKHLAYDINMLLGFNGIKDSKANINLTEKIYRIYQNLMYNIDALNASINYLTLSNAERQIIDAFISKKAKTILSDNIHLVRDKNLPLSIHQLDISAEDLINENIDRIYISKILSTLYTQVLNMCVENKKEDLINLAKEINKTFTEITAKKITRRENEK